MSWSSKATLATSIHYDRQDEYFKNGTVHLTQAMQCLIHSLQIYNFQEDKNEVYKLA